MKMIWASDIHLNFVKKREQFYYKLRKAKADAIVLSGDIAESSNVIQFVKEMEDYTKIPVYFVMGNHDFYESSILKVKRAARKVNWIPKNSGVQLTEKTLLVGVDGWGDCRNGDFDNSRLVMSDWMYIEELKKAYDQGMDSLKETLQALADKDARSLKRKVLKGIKEGNTRIIIVSHVPAFEKACLYAGRKSTPDGLPFFSSQILGTTILPIAKKNPEVDFLWLSGHTHSRVTHKPCDNMTVKVASSEYYLPDIEEIIDVY